MDHTTGISVCVWQALGILVLLIGTANTQSTIICKVPLDVVLILDASSSIAAADWLLMVGFTNNIINNVEIGPNNIRIGLVMFSTSVTIISNLNENNQKGALISTFQKNQRISGGTNTGNALKITLSDVFNANTRKGVKRIVILLTDGQSNNMPQTIIDAKELNAQPDMYVFAVGVGYSYNLQELNAIATKPAVYFVSTLSTFNILNVLVKVLGPKFCRIGLGVVTNITCSTEVDCSSILNSICQLKICTCLSQNLQYDQRTGDCLPRDDGTCNSDEDCGLLQGAVCHDTSDVCACPGQTCQECKLGSPCDSHIICTDGIPGWICNNNIQACNSTRIRQGNYFCRRRGLGDSCNNNADCAEMNGTCINKVCVCSHEALQYNPLTVFCEVRAIGEDCTKPAECAFVNDAECKANKCTCKGTFKSKGGIVCGLCSSQDQFYNEITKKCEFRSIGSDCTSDNDCLQITNSVCKTTCSCADGYGRAGTGINCAYCAIGTYCASNLNCSVPIPNSECLANILQCKSGYVHVNGKCKVKIIMKDCTLDRDCSDKDQGSTPYECSNSKCQCAIGYRADELDVECEEIKYGTKCTDDESCSLSPGTECAEICKCKTGYRKDPRGKGCAKMPCYGVECGLGYCNLDTTKCVCPADYGGSKCQTKVDLCSGVTCHNRGRCISRHTNYWCICFDGWSGNLCTIAPYPCVNNAPCLNGGKCEERYGDNYCACKQFFSGVYCQHEEAHPCTPDPCDNAGVCIPQYGNHYICDCVAGYTGRHCKIAPHPCYSAPCLHGGQCQGLSNATGAFRCWCPFEYSGLLCEYGACKDKLCYNGGTCRRLKNNKVTCNCRPGYKGDFCAIRSDPCLNNPCKNGGRCKPGRRDKDDFHDIRGEIILDSSDEYQCECKFGYKGRRCDDGKLLMMILVPVLCGVALLLLLIICCKCCHPNCHHGNQEDTVVVNLPTCQTPTTCMPTRMGSACYKAQWMNSNQDLIHM